MASPDMFLLVEGQSTGTVKGESADSVYPGQIDVLGWSWGMSSSAAIGGGGGAVKTALSELRIRKLADTATTALMSVMRNGEVIKRAVLTVRKSGGNPIDYFVVKVEQGRITSYDVESQGGPEVSEQFSIAFERIEVQYYEQAQSGARKASSTFSTQVR
jgi:type VI secretion system secreted protein Hcp